MSRCASAERAATLRAQVIQAMVVLTGLYLAASPWVLEEETVTGEVRKERIEADETGERGKRRRR